MGPSDIVNPAAELYKIGEYYYKAGIAAQALYAFKKYLECYPGDEFANEATSRIEAIKSGNFNKPPAGEPAAAAAIAAVSAANAAQDSGTVSDFQSQTPQELGNSGFDLNSLSQSAASPDNVDPFGSNAAGGISDELSSFLSQDPFGG